MRIPSVLATSASICVSLTFCLSASAHPLEDGETVTTTDEHGKERIVEVLEFLRDGHHEHAKQFENVRVTGKISTGGITGDRSMRSSPIASLLPFGCRSRWSSATENGASRKSVATGTRQPRARRAGAAG